MLYYERVNYEDVKTTCICQELDFLVEANRSIIKNYAIKKSIEYDMVIKQIKLHSPQFEKKYYTTKSFIKKNLFPILDEVLEGYNELFDKYKEQSGYNNLFSELTNNDNVRSCKLKWNINKDGLIIFTKGSSVEAEIREVNEKIGVLIEEKLHYLRSARENPVMRIGLFIKNYSWPICYMSFCKVDREDKRIALEKSMGVTICNEDIVELSRVFGIGDLPHNSVSLLVGYSAKKIEKERI